MNIIIVDDKRHTLQEMEDAVSVAMPTAQCFSFQNSQEALAFAKTTPIDIAFWDINMSLMRLYIYDISSANILTQLCPACNVIYCIDDDRDLKYVPLIKKSVYLLKPFTPEQVQAALVRLHYPLSE